MEALQESRIKLICEVDGVTTEGFAIRRDFTVQERALRAGKIFAVLFTLGIGSVVVPILHFVLPFVFLFAACLFAATTWMETSEVLRGEIACPNCKHVNVFQRDAEEWPRVQRCGGCSYTLTIKPA